MLVNELHGLSLTGTLPFFSPSFILLRRLCLYAELQSFQPPSSSFSCERWRSVVCSQLLLAGFYCKSYPTVCCVVTYLCNKHKNGHRVPPFSRSAEHGEYKEGGSSELMYIRNQQDPASLFNGTNLVNNLQKRPLRKPTWLNDRHILLIFLKKKKKKRN